MNKIKEDDQAFPQTRLFFNGGDPSSVLGGGLTIRAYFASRAMNSIIIATKKETVEAKISLEPLESEDSEGRVESSGHISFIKPHAAAELGLEYADALIKKLNEKKGKGK